MLSVIKIAVQIQLRYKLDFSLALVDFFFLGFFVFFTDLYHNFLFLKLNTN